MSLEDLRSAAFDVFQHALRSVDAREAVRDVVNLDGSLLRIADSEFEVSERGIYVVAIGKAAVSMSLGLHDVLGHRISQAIISGPPIKTAALPTTHRFFTGGHPIPNQQSLDAAAAAFKLLDQANREKALVVYLISGGGSAMLEWPVSSDITLEDLRETNRQLITCGAAIREINVVRRSISATKGGQLASRAKKADAVTLIVSDTNRGEESSVASGPTVPALEDARDAMKVLKKYGLARTLPSSVISAMREYKGHIDSIPPGYVLSDNDDALWAATQRAVELGFTTSIATDLNEQPIELGTALLIKRASAMEELPACLISGGEFSCRVSGDGCGGRNLETVLRCALELDRKGVRDHTVILGAGTDGIDGSSFAAGSLADETTIARARELGIDAADYLERSDSHAFFERLDDLIVTGPTGTNVRDIRIVLREKKQSRSLAPRR